MSTAGTLTAKLVNTHHHSTPLAWIVFSPEDVRAFFQDTGDFGENFSISDEECQDTVKSMMESVDAEVGLGNSQILENAPESVRLRAVAATRL